MIPSELPPGAIAFMTARALASLTTLRADGSPHVIPVGYTYDPQTHVVRIISSDATQKVVNADRGGRAVVCQVDGAHWISLEGTTSVARDPESVADASARYAAKYQPPRENSRRVVVLLSVDRVLGRFPDEALG
jgi:F420H(2)-dependent biliverdin reductase